MIMRKKKENKKIKRLSEQLFKNIAGNNIARFFPEIRSFYINVPLSYFLCEEKILFEAAEISNIIYIFLRKILQNKHDLWRCKNFMTFVIYIFHKVVIYNLTIPKNNMISHLL